MRFLDFQTNQFLTSPDLRYQYSDVVDGHVFHNLFLNIVFFSHREDGDEQPIVCEISPLLSYAGEVGKPVEVLNLIFSFVEKSVLPSLTIEGEAMQKQTLKTVERRVPSCISKVENVAKYAFQQDAYRLHIDHIPVLGEEGVSHSLKHGRTNPSPSCEKWETLLAPKPSGNHGSAIVDACTMFS